MTTPWVRLEASYQSPFEQAAQRALRGDFRPCPRCHGELRAYFHAFQPRLGRGTLWVWCGACGLHTRLLRVTPALAFPDPLANVSRTEFSAFEGGRDDPYLDRLERMWNDGTLYRPRPVRHSRRPAPRF